MTTQNSVGLRPKTALIVVVVVMAVLSIGYFSVSKTQAQLSILSNPFGGRIETVFFCTCSAGILLNIGSPVPAEDIVFQFGTSRLYKWYQIFRPGPWTLGLWHAGGVCKVYAGKTCYEVDVEGTISIVGTSM